MNVVKKYFNLLKSKILQIVCGICYFSGLISVLYFAVYKLLSGRISNIATISIILFFGIIFIIVYFLFYKKLSVYLLHIKNKKSGTKAKSISSLQESDISYSKLLKFHRSNKKKIISSPCLIVIGKEGAGKSSLIQEIDIDHISSELLLYNKEKNINWFLNSNSLIIDINGKCLAEQGCLYLKTLNRQLSKSRKGIPANGIIITISSEDIITFSEEKIKRDVDKILFFLEDLSKKSQILIPVYFLVTKSDMIDGFNDFFNLALPDKNNEIIGFDINNGTCTESRNLLKNSCSKFIESLYKIRYKLLAQNTLNTQNEYKSAYSLPTELKKITDNLEKYVSYFDINSQWKTEKSFFSRGVYFTVARSEAGYFKGPLQNTSFERVTWLKNAIKKEKSLYVNDLFTKKILKEKGLCQLKNQNSFTKKIIPKVVYATLITVFTISLFFLYNSRVELKTTLNKEQNLWQQTAQRSNWAFNYFAPILIPKMDSENEKIYGYNNQQRIGNNTVLEYNYKVYKLAEKKINIPFLLRAVDEFSNINNLRTNVSKQVFESSIFCPLLSAVTSKLSNISSRKLTINEYRIIRDLINLTARYQDNTSNTNSSPSNISLTSNKSEFSNINLNLWFEFVLSDKEQATSWAEYVNERGNNPEHSKIQLVFNKLCWSATDKWPGKVIANTFKESQAKNENLFPKLFNEFLNGYSDSFLLNSKGFIAVSKSKKDFFKLLNTELEKFKKNKQHYLESIDIAKAAKINEEWTKLNKSFKKMCSKPEIKESLEKTINLIFNQPKLDKLADIKWNKFSVNKNFYIKSIWYSLGLNPELLSNIKDVKHLSPNQYAFYKMISDGINSQVSVKNSRIVKRLNSIKDVLIVYYYLKNSDEINNKLNDKKFYNTLAGKIQFSKDSEKVFEMIDYLYNLKKGLNSLNMLGDKVNNFKEILQNNSKQTNTSLVVQSIPFTDLDKQNLKSEYLPKSMNSINKAWTDLKKAHDKITVVVAEKEHSAQWKNISLLYAQYLNNYSDYWHELKNKAKVKTFQWDYYKKNISDKQYWSITHSIKEFYDNMGEAMLALSKAYDDKTMPQGLKEELEKLLKTYTANNDKLLQDHAKNIWEFWRHILNLNTIEAREVLLNTSLSKFINKAVVLSGKQDKKSYISDYWRDLSYSFLSSLTNSLEPMIKTQLVQIVDEVKFPFSDKDMKTGMSIKECQELQKKINKLVVTKKDYNNDTLGNSNIDDMKSLPDNLVERLILLKPKLNKSLNEWVSNAKKILLQLSKKGYQNSVNFYFKNDISTDQSDSVSMVWAAIELSQHYNKNTKPTLTRTNKKKSLGEMLFPGNSIEIKLFRSSAQVNIDKPDVSREIKGNWAVLRLLLSGSKRKLGDDGKFWISWKPAIYNSDENYWEVKFTLRSTDGRKFSFSMLTDLSKSFESIQECCRLQKEQENN